MIVDRIASIIPILLLMSMLHPVGIDTGKGGMCTPIDRGPDVDMEIFDSYFIRNLGQVASDEVSFYSKNGNVFFTPTGVTYRFSEREPIYDRRGETEGVPDPLNDIPIGHHERGVVLRYSFVGANVVEPRGRDRCSWNTGRAC